jgi:hypothetical protein
VSFPFPLPAVAEDNSSSSLVWRSQGFLEDLWNKK